MDLDLYIPVQILPLMCPEALIRIMACSKQLMECVKAADDVWMNFSTLRGWGPFQSGVR